MKGLAGKEIKWSAAEVLLVFVAVYLIGSLYNQFGEPVYAALTTIFDPELGDSAYFLLSVILEAAVLTASILIIVMVRHGCRWRDLGFVRGRLGRDLMWGIPAGVAIFYLVAGSDYLTSLLLGQRLDLHPLGEIVAQAASWREMIVPLFLGSLMGPFTEELYFRAFAFPALARVAGIRGGAVLAALMFAFLHMDPWGFLALVAGGLALTALYVGTGSILPAMLAHGVWNALVALSIYVN